MNWKLNPRTGQMEPKISPSKEIEKALIPVHEEPKCFGSCPAEISFRYAPDVDDEINHREHKGNEATEELVNEIFNN